MFRKLLVPLDGTPEAEVALSPAETLAVALGAEVVLIRVIPSGGPTLKALDVPEFSLAQDYLAGVAWGDWWLAALPSESSRGARYRCCSSARASIACAA